MSEIPNVGAFAIVPNSDLQSAIPFWERLGFRRSGGVGNYVIMTGWGCEVHLTQSGDEAWRVSAENNPFGLFSCLDARPPLGRRRCEGRV